ncbi:nuclear transport factor 2 family protein [Microbacterium horticulturae]|uniref:Nuclear transport factor 2 family protein n=1 Tax=Microbacterium horticulturae TaxID=3028316 RepID=A0ABY8BX85_9MICO|nr:nuclear transport factor 2 family protein [Microbacterium sp. KACC 23027]WEG08510.1 nuclear transport factor 2 family protein [Microbacterium sp. KACC 23027]
MEEARFREYIRRFNEEDDTAFEDYLAPDMHMRNGTLEFTGVEGMKDHYNGNIWGRFREQLTVPRFVTDGPTIAIRMLTLFTTLHDDAHTIFGAVRKGETFQFDGLIMYEVDETDRFKDIQVAYNAFIHTDLDGVQRDLGIPH